MDQICPKLIKLDQTWSFLIKLDKNGFLTNVNIKSCHIYKMAVFFWICFQSYLSKMDQTWSNWISHKSKSVSIKSFQIYKKVKNGCLILDFFGSGLSKMDRTWSNWISHQSKNLIIKVVKFTERIIMTALFFLFFGFRSVQNGSNLIKLYFLPIKKCYF